MSYNPETGIAEIVAKIETRVVVYSTCKFKCLDCGSYVIGKLIQEGVKTKGKGWHVGDRVECPYCDETHTIIGKAKK